MPDSPDPTPAEPVVAESMAHEPPVAEIVGRTLDWYDRNARDLPWRRAEATPWGVMVSEFMLQQTPVNRVLPVWTAWLERWPTPAALAAASSADVLHAWGRLGYPRRAVRLRAAAVAIVERHDGRVPERHADLLALPGVGDYTAAAVASFAFGARHVVLDTNVRRVIARSAAGRQFPANHPTAAERALAEGFVPDDPATAARWAVASMELGALLCTARTPHCERCPLAESADGTGPLCAWLAAGRPEHDGPPRKGQAWEGTDRQCRGALLQALRGAQGPVDESALVADVDHPRDQARRCLESLIDEHLVHRGEQGIGLGAADH